MDDVSAKIITLFVLIVLTLVFGCLPYFLVLRGSRSLLSSRFRDVAFACLNTFAGGVFLGTLLLHLMIEGGEEFEDWKKQVGWDNDFPLFNTFIFVGFLTAGLVEHFMNSCIIKVTSGLSLIKANVSTQCVNSSFPTGNICSSNRAGSVPVDRPSICTISENQTHEVHDDKQTVSFQTQHRESKQYDVSHHDSQSQHQCIDPGQHHRKDALQAFLLLLALSFHTIFDGLAVGLQREAKGVWKVFLGIALHKTIVAFCLGFALFKSYKAWKAVLWMVMFSLISPLGIGLGILVTSGQIGEHAEATCAASGILQGVASGVFMYVTFLEILSSYMGHSCVRDTKFIYFVFIAAGFAVMAVLKAIAGHEH